MPGTKEGGLNAATTNRARHGEDFYQRIGRKGGIAPYHGLKGFAAMPREKVSAAGKKGGANSKRGPAAKIMDYESLEEL